MVIAEWQIRASRPPSRTWLRSQGSNGVPSGRVRRMYSSIGVCGSRCLRVGRIGASRCRKPSAAALSRAAQQQVGPKPGAGQVGMDPGLDQADGRGRPGHLGPERHAQGEVPTVLGKVLVHSAPRVRHCVDASPDLIPVNGQQLVLRVAHRQLVIAEVGDDILQHERRPRVGDGPHRADEVRAVTRGDKGHAHPHDLATPSPQGIRTPALFPPSGPNGRCMRWRRVETVPDYVDCPGIISGAVTHSAADS